MNKYIRKSLALLLVLAILIVSFSINVFAVPQLIDQTVKKQDITSGVVLESYNRFTTSGWIKSDVLTVDLSNENVKVDSLVHKTSASTLTTVRNLAKNYDAIAAVNGSYFDTDTGNAYGPVMSSGQFDLAATRNNTDLATFSLDYMNNALFEYWDTKVELVTPSGDREPIAAYNRYSGYYNYKLGMYIVDSKWNPKSPGVSAAYPNDWYEMVVENGVVKEFRIDQPGVDIPKNGYVVLATFGHGENLMKEFKVGDPVNYDITMNVDKSNMKMALTGGTLLVQDGQVISKFTKYPSGVNTREPCTAVGTTADGKTLKVVTVDGRSSTSIGMTQAELAAYMKELGCANAINYDGGGSTTMIARTAGTTGLTAVNSPSDDFERGVANGLGIFSVAPKGPVDTLLVSSYEDNVFVNTSRAFTVKGIDKYMNPVAINSKDIKWSVSGVSGTFKDNVFYPTSVGEAIVTAKIGDNVVGTCPISVLSAPVRLELNYDKLNTEAGKSTTFALKGWNKNGYSASIPPYHANWSVTGKVGTRASNIFTAGKTGTGYVSASFAGVNVFCPVSIKQPGVKKVIEDFSSSTMVLDLSSKAVTAKYAPATNVYKSAPYSAKLTYDFTKELKNARAAYINLPNGGYTLDSSTTKLGMWVYSSAKKPVWIGTMVSDKSGKVYYKYFSKGITWTGWKYLEVSLDDVKTPNKVTKVYAIQPTKVKASGNVYFDNLTMVYSGYPEVAATKSTNSTVPKDTSYADRTVSGSDSLSFSVFGQSEAYTADKNKTQTTMLSALSARINKYLQASVVVGTVDNLWPSVKVPLLSTTAGYKSLDMNGNRLIQLKTTNGDSMRMTDSNQWLWFKNQLSSFTGKNVFVFLAMKPDNFKDSQEGDLLKETLTNYKKQNPSKNVWVFYNGSTNSSYIERGIKYVSTAGFNSAGFSDQNKAAAKFVVVRVKGSTVTYQFKSFN